jgi:hypothetical protein
MKMIKDESVFRSKGQDALNGVSYRLAQRFSDGIFPAPSELTDTEIACIAGWAGDDDTGTFTRIDIIDEYGLDVKSGENTWPQFSAMLNARKSAWKEANPLRARQQIAKEDLELAIEECAVAGISQNEIIEKVERLCAEICP